MQEQWLPHSKGKTKLLLLFLAVSTRAQKWSQNSVSTDNLSASVQSNVVWNFQTSKAIGAGDCIIWDFPNPYSGTSTNPYKTFKTSQKGPTPCTLETAQQNYSCEIMTNTKFKITFGSASAGPTRITGKTSGNPFQNPYSARQIPQFAVSLYKGCDEAQSPLVSSTITSYLQFIPGELKSSQVSFTSSSNVIGFRSGVDLNVSMKPTSTMPKIGKILIKSPQWYLAASTAQGFKTNQMSSDYLFDLNSVGTLVSGSPKLQFISSQFQQASGILAISFQHEEDGWTDELTLKISNFKNPINRAKKLGFAVSTSDSRDVLIDTTQSDFALTNLMTTSQALTYVQLTLLGDDEGLNVGQVGKLNAFSLEMISPIPLEPNCYFEIQMPSQLKIQEITRLEGSGFFSNGQDQMNPEQYTLDLSKNTLTVKGCLLPNQMQSVPSGSVTVYSVRLPNYIQASDPLNLKLYANSFKTDVVVDTPLGPNLKPEDMTPGTIEMIEFKPSNFAAFAVGVSFNIQLILQSGLQKAQKMVLIMPKRLKFDSTCSVLPKVASCVVDTKTNTITLLGVVSLDLPPGSGVSFVINSAGNPAASMPCGSWQVLTYISVGGIWYIQDGGKAPESFMSLPGSLDSKLNYANKITFSSDTTLQFTSTTEHDIPTPGFIRVKIPNDCAIIDPPKSSGLDLVSFESKTGTIILNVPNGLKKGIPISYTVTGIRNPRSFQPSDVFTISSVNDEGYVVDQGQNVNVIMSVMSSFQSLQINAVNLTNGVVGDFLVQLESKVEVRNSDIFYFTLPKEMSAKPGNLPCSPDKTITDNNLIEVTCQSAGQIVQVTFNKITEPLGKFYAIVGDIKNPPSFRKSNVMADVVLKTSSNYNIQTVADPKTMFIQTNKVANITVYSQKQETEQYGEDTTLTLQFYPLNPLPVQGVFTIAWPNTVAIYADTLCTITTSKLFTSTNTCVIDLKNQVILIQGVFDKVYSGQIQIFLSRVRNPNTNKGMIPYVIQTFDDQTKTYPSDILQFYSLLECHYTCRYCGTDKNYCTECWPGDENTVLMKVDVKSQCKAECDFGWTTNGDLSKKGGLCVPCDSSCLGCADDGVVGDYMRCLKCNPEFQFQDVTTGQCLSSCPVGTFDRGDQQCGKCNKDCLECTGTDTCTSCNQSSSLPVLLGDKCLKECPYGFGNKGGVCVKCQSPCLTCSTGANICTTCDGTLERKFRYGPTCYETCPIGTEANDLTGTCTGCSSGCLKCNQTDNSQCFVCDNLLLHLGMCVNSCPTLYIPNFEQTKCVSIDSLDVKLVYFPFLFLIVCIGFVNWVGNRVKPRHQILPNFIVMMGILEHIALIVQIALCFSYGSSIAFAIISIIIWLLYVAGQVVFWKYFKTIIEQDKLLKKWMSNSANKYISKAVPVIGSALSWKCYKLLYSHFFGYQVKTTDFSNPEKYTNLMKKLTYANIIGVYAPLIILNIAGLATSTWGVQLYVQYIENIILSAVMIGVGLYEQKTMPTMLDFDATRRAKLAIEMKPLTVFGHYDDDKSSLVNKFHTKTVFLAQTLDALVDQFGKRSCQSMGDLQPRDMEEDPRKCRTYPMSPQLPQVIVDRPPKPLGPIQPNNCYNEPKERDQLIILKPQDGKGRNKACQAGGPFADDLKRNDADLISTQLRSEQDNGFKSDQKRHRGRKNRYFEQIDREDHKAGAILDSDDEGETANRKARNEHLNAIREEEELLSKTVLADDLKVEIERKLEQQRIQAQIEEQQAQDKIRAADFKIKIDASERNLKASQVTTGKEKESPVKVEPQVKMETLVQKKVSSGKVAPLQEAVIQLPDSILRNFNEAQILGDFNREANGQIINNIGADGKFRDLKQRIVTSQGYLLNNKGEIISNRRNTTVMFKKLVDGELPAPFCLEKFNFSPWEILGKLVYEDVADPLSFQQNVHEERSLDQNKCPINSHGFLMDAAGDIIRYTGEKVFYKEQLVNGELPLLYTYGGKTFDIADVMGVLDVFEGKALLAKSTENGRPCTRDQGGHLVNERGYLITKEGHICNRQGRVLFHKDHLKAGDFPKFFNFTKFSRQMFLGDLNLDKKGIPVLTRDKNGKFQDKKKKTVSQGGYLIDLNSNIIDKAGNVMFEKNLVDNQGQLPELFRGGYLTQILSEHEQQIGSSADESAKEQRQKTPLRSAIKELVEDRPNETSYGSQMDDSPAKYDQANQRGALHSIESRSKNASQSLVADPDINYNRSGSGGLSSKKKKRKSKKKKDQGLVQVKQFYESDIMMADAYGGVAQPRVRMVPKRFASVHRERVGGIRNQPPQMQNLTTSQHAMYNPFTAKNGMESQKNGMSSVNDDITNAVSGAAGKSNVAIGNNDLEQKRNLLLQNKNSDALPRDTRTAGITYDQEFDEEFEKLYKKDIDQFIDGSNFEVESLSGFSELSGGHFSMADANPVRAKQLEQQYLAKLEEQKDQLNKVRANTRKESREGADQRAGKTGQ